MMMRILVRVSHSTNWATTWTIAWAFCLILFVTLASRPAVALEKPDCDSYAAWAMTLDKKDKWQLNSVNKRLNLPALYKSPQVENLFGKPALSWTRADVKAAIKQAKTCGREARKAKRKKERLAFRNIASSLHNRLNGFLGRSVQIQLGLDQAWAKLNEAPVSRQKLLAFGALHQMSAGGGLDPVYWRVISGSREPAYHAAVGVVTSLRDLPDTATEKLRPEIDHKFDALRAPVVAAVQEELNASPATLEGLKGLRANLAATRKELGTALTEDDLAALDQAAADRGRAIEDALLAEQIAAIKATPESVDGLNAVNSILAGPVTAALTEPRLGTLRQAAVDRRQAIGDVVIDSETTKLADFPATLDGLHQLRSFEAQVLARLDENRTGLSLTGFKHAVVERFAVLGRDALSDYKNALAALPEDETGLKALARFDSRNAAVIKRIRRSTRQQYQAAHDQRQAALTEAVVKENTRLAALPLAGGVFAEHKGPRFEFSEKKERVYMHMAGDVTVAGEYETDGDKVILKFPQANMVFQRDGAWLKGNGLELKRQPDS